MQHMRTLGRLCLATVVMLAIGVGSAAAASNHQVTAEVKKGTLVVEGTDAGEEIVLRLRAGDATTLEVVTPDGILAFARDTFTRIAVEADDGDDLLLIDQTNGVFTDTEATTLSGGHDDDDLLGGAGVETFLGGPGDDEIDGNQGTDEAFLGSGDDSFTWDPGDGSDKVEGQPGDDTMIFNGAGASESFDASANGKRLRFFRDLGNIVMDVDGTERIDLRALGGADTTVMNDLRRTDVEAFDIDLAPTIGGTTGDGQADTVTLFGSDSPGRTDDVQINAFPDAVQVTGLSANVSIAHPETANDLLSVNTLGGNDDVAGSLGLAARLKLAVDGGAGEDTILGGDGADLLLGGDGDDDIDGNAGADVAHLDAGEDGFTWDPGDGSDLVEGGDGTDTMIFNGSAGNEVFALLANGERLSFTRNLGNIVMDVNEIEQIDLEALDGTDLTTINDLSGTDVRDITVDLEGVLGGGGADGAADTVTVNATDGVDLIDVAAVAGETHVTGLTATVRIAHADPLLDKLIVNTLGGVDLVNVGEGVAALIGVTVNQ